MTKVGNAKNLDASVKTINPRAAREYLKRGHPHNRRIAKNRVEKLSKAMVNGEWIVAQPIMVNCDGTLIDGHHRMHAVIEAKKPVDFLVLAGFDTEGTFGRIDQVMERKLSHWLQMRGEPKADLFAAIAMMRFMDIKGRIPTSRTGNLQVSAVQMLEFIDDHPEIRMAVVDAPGQVNRLVSPALVCFSYLKFSAKNKAEAKSFWIDFVNGDSYGPMDPVAVLRKRMEQNRKAKEKLPRTEILALVFKAWNATRERRDVRTLKWITQGTRPESFPEVV